MEGAGHRVIWTAATNAGTATIGTATETGADAHQSALQIGWQHAVDRQRRVHAATRLVRYGKV